MEIIPVLARTLFPASIASSYTIYSLAFSP
jgi:hypothetical protein